MKALSVRQPWASLIASGAKTVEIRSTLTRHRGPLLICVSKSTHVSEHGRAAAERFGLDLANLPRGVAICTVNLVDAREPMEWDESRSCCPIADDEVCWLLSDVMPIVPFPVSGKLGIFEAEPPRTGNQSATLPNHRGIFP